MINNYTQQVIANLSKEIDINYGDNNSSNFIGVCNHAMWQKMITSTEFNNFQITIPSETALSDFFESTIYAIALTKYAQNCLIDSPIRNLKVNDRLFLASKNEIYLYMGIENGKVWLRPLKEGRHADNTYITPNVSVLEKMFLLNDSHNLTCHTVTYFKNYHNDFASKFPDYKALTSFCKKTLIIASKEFVESHPQKQTLPIRYNLDTNSKVPIEPLIEIVSDFNIAENLLWSENHGIEDVIFIGNAKYKDAFVKALEHQANGRIKKIVVVGSQSIAKDYHFTSWHWTFAELQSLRGKTGKNFELYPIENKEITQLKLQLEDFTENLIVSGVNAEEIKSVMNRYLNYFLIPVVVTVENTPFPYFLEELQCDESDFDIILDNAGIEGNGQKQLLIDILKELNTLLSKVQPKYEAIEKLWNDKNIKVTYVVVKSKRDAQGLSNFIEGKKGLKVLTHQELKNILRNPQNDLFNEQGNLRRNQFIFPYIHLNHDFQKRTPLSFYSLYEETLQYGQSIILYYRDIEGDRLKNIQFFAERQQIQHLTHPDRQMFVDGLFYEISAPITEEYEPINISATDEILSVIEAGFDKNNVDGQKEYEDNLSTYFSKFFGEVRRKSKKIDEYFGNDDSDEEGVISKSTVTQEPFSNIKYKIIFDDNSYISSPANEIIACKARHGDNIEGIRVDKLEKADKVIDFNITFDNSFSIFETIPEAKEPIRKIQEASKEWRNWLQYSLQNYKHLKKLNDDDAYKMLLQKLGVNVSLDTVKRWLTSKDKYSFPKEINDLEKILDLRIRQTKQEDQPSMRKRAEQIRESRNTSASFKEVITKLKMELGVYLIKKEKGDTLKRITQNQIYELLTHKQSKSIIKIEKL
jgi:hypothetical protein